MAIIESIVFTLFDGLYDYVPNRKKKEYTDEFNSRKTLNTKFALSFFPKYIDFEKWSKNPKDPYDTLLINYWMIEVPVIGLKYSNLLGSYSRGNRILNKRLKKKSNSPVKIRSVKKKKQKPTREQIPILSQRLLDLFNEVPKEKTTTKNIKSEFNNEQMLLHFADITDEITLKLSNDDSTKEDFNILYRNKIITVDQSMFEFAFAYTELEKKYRLEGISLIDEILKRGNYNFTHFTQNKLSFFLKEIVKQKKYFDEKEKWKKRVVWLKK